ncbi:hypothetical protein FACS189476_02770 [Spirochaetia bacterium]|nr:hypothetical protein FACS189476_02770 [Spirochaetia bacterium]
MKILEKWFLGITIFVCLWGFYRYAPMGSEFLGLLFGTSGGLIAASAIIGIFYKQAKIESEVQTNNSFWVQKSEEKITQMVEYLQNSNKIRKWVCGGGHSYSVLIDNSQTGFDFDVGLKGSVRLYQWLESNMNESFGPLHHDEINLIKTCISYNELKKEVDKIINKDHIDVF